MATSLVKIGAQHKATAVNYYYKGIEMDPKLESNYRLVHLLEKNAKKSNDFIAIAKVCVIARENVSGKEIDFLIREAEAYYNAGKEDEATKLFNSIYKYVTKAEIKEWAKNKKDGVKQNKKDYDRVATFITFLNHRAIHFRQIKQYEKSLDDLNTAISLDTDNSYFDIYYNLSKAMLSALNDKNVTTNYTKNDALDNLSKAITIALNLDLHTYENLLKTIKDDSILSPYIISIRSFLKNSHYSIPVFFK
jgi:tetratricopeptide (TPR) repeat protein